MNGSIPDDKIEEIRRRADIVSLIGEYVTLKKAGKNYLGLCPFHREKTPSFTVSPDKQMFYCFGCSEGGNVVSFLMKLNHLTFPEAVRHLAGKVGVVIPERTMSREEKERYTLGEQIRQINELAAGFFTRMRSSRRPERAPGSISGREESASMRSGHFASVLPRRDGAICSSFWKRKEFRPSLRRRPV